MIPPIVTPSKSLKQTTLSWARAPPPQNTSDSVLLMVTSDQIPPRPRKSTTQVKKHPVAIPHHTRPVPTAEMDIDRSEASRAKKRRVSSGVEKARKPPDVGKTPAKLKGYYGQFEEDSFNESEISKDEQSKPRASIRTRGNGSGRAKISSRKVYKSQRKTSEDLDPTVSTPPVSNVSISEASESNTDMEENRERKVSKKSKLSKELSALMGSPESEEPEVVKVISGPGRRVARGSLPKPSVESPMPESSVPESPVQESPDPEPPASEAPAPTRHRPPRTQNKAISYKEIPELSPNPTRRKSNRVSVAPGAAAKKRARNTKAWHLFETLKPKYVDFACEWKGCPARLFNLERLRKHMEIVHVREEEKKGTSGRCMWEGCCIEVSVPSAPNPPMITSTLPKATIFTSTLPLHAAPPPPVYQGLQFSNLSALRTHIEESHMIPISWHLGDGPIHDPDDPGPQITTQGAPLPSYLFRDGVQITPDVREQTIESESARKARHRMLKKLWAGVMANMPSEDEDEDEDDPEIGEETFGLDVM